MRRPATTILYVMCAVLAAACSRARTYELRGQVIAVDAARGELTVRHEDIKGFMPGMTMAFRVEPRDRAHERAAGDIIRARLVVEESAAYLTDVAVTGHAPLTDAAPPIRAGDLLDPGAAVPDQEFTDQAGARRRLSSWRTHTLAVGFTYTRCPLPDFCPLMDRHFAAVQREVLADAWLRGRVQLLSVSIDPAFDTPAVLASHAARVGADPAVWHLLTGEPEKIRTFAARFGVSVLRHDDGTPDLVHNLRTAVVDRGGRLVRVLRGNTWTPADLLRAIKHADAGA